MFCIPPAPAGIPTPWKGHYYGRNGESKVALSVAKLEEIRRQASDLDWSSQVCPEATLDDLDPAGLEVARDKVARKIGARNAKDDVAAWDTGTFLDKARLTRNGQLTQPSSSTSVARQAGISPSPLFTRPRSPGSSRPRKELTPVCRFELTPPSLG